MQLITGEFLILALLIFVSNYIRARYSVLESLIRGLVVFFPPEKPAEGQKILYVQIDDKFSQKSPFFADAELLVIIVYLALGVNLISALLQLNPWVNIGMSVSFYLIIMGLLLCIYGQFKQVIKSGLTHPDNLLGLVCSLVLFFLQSLILNYKHEDFLDFNFHMSTELLELQLKATLNPYLPHTFEISVNYLQLTLLLSFFSALAVYPTFKYINRFVNSYSDSTISLNKRLYGFLIISPLFITTL